MQKLDIIGIGTLLMDVFLREGEKKVSVGGCLSNTVLTMASLGLKVGVIGRVGRDKEGKHIKKILEKIDIDASRLAIDNFPTTKSYMKIDNGNSRYLHSEHFKVYKIPKKDIEYLESSRAFFIKERNVNFDAIIDNAQKMSKRVYTTLHGFKTGDKLKKHISKANVIFVNEVEFEYLKPYLKTIFSNNSVVVMTLGSKGSITYTAEGTNYFSAFKIVAVDTTGAGDSFAAGYIYGDFKKWPLEKKCMFANAMGALACLQYGARSRLYSYKEVADFIRSKDKSLYQKYFIENDSFQ